MSTQSFDLAIVGAGPAGMAAATRARKEGVTVVVFDEQTSPGGQMYRAITQTPVRRREVLGLDYWHGTTLVEPFRASGAVYLPATTVWAIERRDDSRYELGVSAGRHSVRHAANFLARAVILAPGALERPFPIAGATLPGVMTAGAAQLMLKTSGLMPTGRTVLAGLGPLLWLTAWQHLNAGATIDTLLETIPRGRLAEAMRHAPGFMFSGYLAKGLELVRSVRRKVRVVEHVESLAAIGEDRVRAVRYAAHGAEHTIDARSGGRRRGSGRSIPASAAGSRRAVAAGADVPGLGDQRPSARTGSCGDGGRSGAFASKPGGGAAEDRGEIEAEAVDAGRGRPMAQRVQASRSRRAVERDGVAAAGVVDRAPGRREAVIGPGVEAAQRQRLAPLVALAGVVEDDVEDDVEPRRVQRRDGRGDLGDAARRKARVGGQEGDRVVAPAVDEAEGRQMALVDPGGDRHQLDRGDAERDEVVDRGRVGEARRRCRAAVAAPPDAGGEGRPRPRRSGRRGGRAAGAAGRGGGRAVDDRLRHQRRGVDRRPRAARRGGGR